MVSELTGKPVAQRAKAGLADLSSILLGFDVDPASEGRVLADYLAARGELRAEGADVVPDEIGLLSLFADLAELSRNRPAGEESSELRVHSDREHFHRYLHSLDVERAGLPDHFRDRLAAVLGHYGVTDLTRTRQLEEAVFRIFLAQQRFATDLGIVTAVLRSWVDEPTPAPELAASARAQLERLVRSTQRRFPVVGDLARSIRFRWFDQPQVDRERTAALAGVAAEIDALAADPNAPDRDARLDALAAIPEHLVNHLAARLERGVSAHEPMLEVLLKRHYADFGLHDLRAYAVEGRAFAVGDYQLDGRPTRLVSSLGTIAEVTDPGCGLHAGIADALADRSGGDDAVVELYVRWPGMPDDDEASAELGAALAAAGWAGQARRVVVSVIPSDDRPVSYFAFRPDGSGLVEDERVRGIHPMVGRRLDLWRLRDFDVTRIAAPEEVMLYECVAKTNPADRRLVAMAQVRQLAAVRDADGRVIPIADEAALYAAAGLPFIAPELREALGEVDEAPRLPELVQLSDIRGVLHCHSHYSDGAGTIRELAAAAHARGWRYLLSLIHI
mgnify:CR=1 FL=1